MEKIGSEPIKGSRNMSPEYLNKILQSTVYFIITVHNLLFLNNSLKYIEVYARRILFI
ncbi:hypothetical protein GLOIN_2v1511726 [Rhizophagus irregularis DAOM 181602=DAOM 197198]|uniref:Uncharacterized protein n=1 Tax=Rhizophagus irregularis (strain DAOM 181602 / DAOM 197198 / MUCL 43194) TaxID=747089 RepID=A0A2P4QTH2_RHIID|nr:hypothetical protein GLOIN_2v1511726 [Rhizophagus irregularis DAOM 181602=DAOM 197198]POG80943.1 hypothetical protein GLOIN_2v1511726 [Rhizophagus irregularis DAOM 181602=DAOM 197198]GET53416.1 hypothetical protein GLOIN_2v1511726 [Rhizophagus irregularis DAOM 181602=DAOM 197198]|eukprot:XP_025187809.1 hypothetical protein GLOIN_2v1511726 [Rhizophagus irregularis DAOM 181602=DAOM 197198]